MSQGAWRATQADTERRGRRPGAGWKALALAVVRVALEDLSPTGKSMPESERKRLMGSARAFIQGEQIEPWCDMASIDVQDCREYVNARPDKGMV